LHKIIKACGLLSCASSEPYCFPDIFKETSQIDEGNPKEKIHASFQRVFINVDSGLPGETTGKFRKTESNSESEERMDYQKNHDELIRESQKKEAEAYQNGVRDGHTEGFSQGRKTGVTEGLKEIETMLHSLQQAMQEIKKLRKVLCLNAEKETVRLSLAIARKILIQEPATNPRVIADVVKKTFETIAINAPVCIRINPSELAYMRERRHLIPIEGDVTFVEDASISCGGCVVESLSGDVDARIESQLEMIEAAFLPGMEKNNLDLEKLS
jgi:flagellar biosynthesis/type III secretory pathway protein FliH